VLCAGRKSVRRERSHNVRESREVHRSLTVGVMSEVSVRVRTSGSRFGNGNSKADDD
jgi:hypothetical protein